MTYIGETGTTGGLFVPAGSAERLTMRSGTVVDIVASSDATGGQFGLYRWDLPPSAHGPDPHFHKTFSESFYVLSGTIGFYDGREWVDATAGSFLYIPEGGVHAYRPADDQSASMLTLFSPGTPREKYFEEMAQIAASGRKLSEEEMADVFARHDQYWAR
jgi:quercetin dioxygenase-like cupin family protein